MLFYTRYCKARSIQPRMLHRFLSPSVSVRTSSSLHNAHSLFVFYSSLSTTSRDLKVFNALSGQCEPFLRETSAIPNVLKWYTCGPTVYDKAHLGYARTYVSQDILLRVTERTGGYKVQLVMGVTDVDDKIIKRANEQNVSFQTLARKQEIDFFQDMAKLYVKPPTVITRVSEHLPEIVKYVKEIEKKGFAYKAEDGSGVYFSTQKLGDRYGKLDPRRRTLEDAAKQAEAMAAVEESQDVEKEEDRVKQNPRDFALWKATKEPDEPAWQSPWGMGRPGWHIECSAMTHHVLGDKLDVHTGGVDLRFPHHNNEIAQCEAYNHGPSQCGHGDEWCKHFVHFGHLYIRGKKMSKSLKNFISVKDFLEDGHTADQFRIMCLQFKYRTSLIYSEDRIRDAEVVVERLRRFFHNVMTYGGDLDIRSSAELQQHKSKRCEERDLELLDALFKTQAEVDEGLLDDLDTPRALLLLLNLASRGNTYVLAHRCDAQAPDEILIALTGYMLEVLDLFGLEGLHAEFSAVMRQRFAVPGQKKPNERNGLINKDEQEAVVRSLLNFRAAVRKEALRDPRQSSNARVLTLRNEELRQFGIQVEDVAPGYSVYKLLSLAEREAAQRAKKSTDKTLIQNDEAALALRKKQHELETLMQIHPSDLFKKLPEYAGRFDTFDATGFPTLENGKLLKKSQRKKLAKKLAKHEKSYVKYWETQDSGE